MNRRIKNILILHLLIIIFYGLLIKQVRAELSLRGFADTYRAVQTESPNDYLGARTRLRLEGLFESDQSAAFASVNAVQNEVVTSETGVDLMESYLEYTSENWDARLGKQIIIWGKGDGLQVTDIISPKDYSEFLARDFDDTRLGVDALKLRWLGDNSDLEFIWIPSFREAVTPTTESPWYVEKQLDYSTVEYNDAIKPENRIKNSEIALKYSLYLSGVDLAFSLFNTWNDLPTMYYDVSGDTITFSPEYHRLNFGAFEFSMSLGEVILWGEIARFKGRYYETDASDDQFLIKDSVDTLLGLDWNPGGGWSASLQVFNSSILDYEKSIQEDENDGLAKLYISKTLLREQLKLYTSIFYGMNKQDLFNQTAFDYALTDNLHVFAGVDVFSGDKEGDFGQYEDNDEIWFKAKYSF